MSGREQKLVWGFGVALAVFAVLFISTTGARWVKDLFSENDRLRERVEQLEALVASRSTWEQRDGWLDQSTPHFASRQEASAALLEAVELLGAGGADGVQVKSQQLSEPAGEVGDDGESGNDYFEATSVKLEVEAGEAALYQWIHQLQQPDSFRGITALTLERGEAGSLRAELELTQFYLP